MLALLIFLLLTLGQGSYNVGFSPMSPVDGGLEPTMKRFADDFAEADGAGVNVLLYAEFSLVWPSSRQAVTDACQNTSFVLGNAQKLLQMASNVSAVLINFCECSDGKVYNVNYVVTRDGVIATYRKSHVWFTRVFDEPDSPDLVTVSLFNRTFGLFMCYDILFSSPGPALRAKGVTRFLYNAAIPVVGTTVFRLWSLKEKASLYAAGGFKQVGAFIHGKRIDEHVGNIFIATNQD